MIFYFLFSSYRWIQRQWGRTFYFGTWVSKVLLSCLFWFCFREFSINLYWKLCLLLALPLSAYCLTFMVLNTFTSYHHRRITPTPSTTLNNLSCTLSCLFLSKQYSLRPSARVLSVGRHLDLWILKSCVITWSWARPHFSPRALSIPLPSTYIIVFSFHPPPYSSSSKSSSFLTFAPHVHHATFHT